MAIYRLSAVMVKRSEGRNVVAAAAYRSGTRLEDERSGQVFDYGRKRVLHAEILAPESAPRWTRIRERLWNAAEAAEKRKDAQLAREVQLALPHELEAAQRLALVRAFVLEQFVDRGMAADIALHPPDREGDVRNFHAHVLLTLRLIAGGGFGPKQRDWNDEELLRAWRASWADHVNAALARAGAEARVDHRSLIAQGQTRVAQRKAGAMARRGIITDRGDEIRATHERHRQTERPPDPVLER
jgi:ATP-dependent exoDNAse (exonuclease V) alpha subunit